MRKRLIASIPQGSQVAVENQNWLDLESIAVVDITSEETEFPIESALLPEEPRGWRAAASGAQTIRLRRRVIMLDTKESKELPLSAYPSCPCRACSGIAQLGGKNTLAGISILSQR